MNHSLDLSLLQMPAFVAKEPLVERVKASALLKGISTHDLSLPSLLFYTHTHTYSWLWQHSSGIDSAASKMQYKHTGRREASAAWVNAIYRAEQECLWTNLLHLISFHLWVDTGISVTASNLNVFSYSFLAIFNLLFRDKPLLSGRLCDVEWAICQLCVWLPRASTGQPSPSGQYLIPGRFYPPRYV